VRSNSKGTLGFLKTANRANVLLTRAMHGMYILGMQRNEIVNIHKLKVNWLGNAETITQKYSIWGQVIEILQQNNNIGPEIHIKCENHPDTITKIKNPTVFFSL
jgi:hypothetical protein